MKKLLFLFLFSYSFVYSQTFTEINPTSYSSDGTGIYVNTSGYRTANDITVYPNTDFTLNCISANVVVQNGGSVNSVDITYYDDDNGKPGNEIGTENNVVPVSQDIVYSSGNDILKVVLNVTPIVLNGTLNQSTKYWISIVADVSNTDLVWWELSLASTNGLRIYERNSGTWNLKGYGDAVYEFSGDMAPMPGLSCNPLNANPEDFETSDLSSHCWTLYNSDSSDAGFIQTSSQAHNGSSSVYHASTDLASEGTSYLVSPAISVNFFDVLSFWYYQHNLTNFGESKVLISTTSDDPISNPDAFIPLVSLDENVIGGYSEDVWTKHVESLRQYSGETIYIAFMYSGDASHELYIDDFEVSYDNLAYDETFGAMHVDVVDESVTDYGFDVLVTGSNVGATNSSIINGSPSCGSFAGGDIWFKFEVPETGAVQIVYPDFTIFGFSEVGHALYDSPLSTDALICGINGNQWNEIPSWGDEFVYFTGLVKDETYYLRVWDSTNDNFGSVYFCLKEYTDPNPKVNDINNTVVNIYPNPAKDFIYIDSNENIDFIYVSDISGKELYNEKSNLKKVKIKTENYSSGIYFMKIISNNKTTVQKIIIKK